MPPLSYSPVRYCFSYATEQQFFLLSSRIAEKNDDEEEKKRKEKFIQKFFHRTEIESEKKIRRRVGICMRCNKKGEKNCV